MVKEGHELANHTWYDRASLRLSDRQLKVEISLVDTILKALGQEPKLFRPGGGFFNQKMIKTVTDLDYLLILGSNYPHDGERILRLITPTAWYQWSILNKVSPGDIIILHDVETAIATLEVIIPKLLEQGYKITTVSQLLLS